MLPLAIIPTIPALGAIGGEVVVILLIAIVLFVIFKFAKTLMKFLLTILLNSILGLIALFVFNSVLALAIPIDLPVILVTALFGLPAVFILVILKFFGLLV